MSPHVVVVLAHANGFCREVWRAVEAELHSLAANSFSGRLCVTALDMPGHGLTGSALDLSAGPPNWDDVGTYILLQVRGEVEKACANGSPFQPLIIGAGHSLGGAGCVLAELQAPGTFDRLLLWEPILFDPDPEASSKRRAGRPDKASISARRRADFESPAAALEYFARKPLFQCWDRRSLEGYVAGGLRPKDVRNGVWELSCAPAVEAAYFSSGIPIHRWRTLNQGLEPTCPIRISVGEATNISLLSPSYYHEQVFGGNRSVLAEMVPDAGHLDPMERPAAFAQAVFEVILAAVKDWEMIDRRRERAAGGSIGAIRRNSDRSKL